MLSARSGRSMTSFPKARSAASDPSSCGMNLRARPFLAERFCLARPTLPTISFCGLGGVVRARRSASVARRSVSSSLY